MVSSGGAVPLWQQVVNLIRSNIERGEWLPETQIPSERELCERFNISRTTVRQAIQQSVSEGLLKSVHGKGTFVAGPKIRQPLFQITGFEATLQSMGLTPSTRLLTVARDQADVTGARLLGLHAGGEIVRFRMLGLGNGEPMAVYDSVVPGTYGSSLLAEVERRHRSGQTFFINELLAEMNGWGYVTADQTYEAIVAEGEEARLLRLSGREPVFRVTSLFQNPSGQPAEYRRAVYRGDKYQFHVTRQMYFAKKEEQG